MVKTMKKGDKDRLDLGMSGGVKNPTVSSADSGEFKSVSQEPPSMRGMSGKVCIILLHFSSFQLFLFFNFV